MLIEKEVIAPGTYWYTDQETGLPRKLDVTPDLTKYWGEQGNLMLSSGLTVPVPCEHDFNAHPMTPADRLKSNAGWVKEYRVRDIKKGDPFYDPTRGEVKDVLFASTEIEDPEIYKKLPTTIRWTSPWINSFTDGQGKQWNNVISHLALTTRPRITKQSPFPNIAAALSMASPVSVNKDHIVNEKGFFLSRATRLVRRKSDKAIVPLYPIAFSLVSGVALGDDSFPPKKDKKKPPAPGAKPGADADGDGDSDVENMDGSEIEMDDDPTNDDKIDAPPFNDPKGDVTMEELLCDLLGALGIHVEKTGNEEMFKRSLYTATMTKVHELTNKAQQDQDQPQPGEIGKQFKDKPGTPGSQPNPLIQQEQQPMYMSLEEIAKITDPTFKAFAISVYNDRIKADAKAAEAEKLVNSLRDKTLKEENAKRQQRVTMLSKVSPKLKADLEAMVAQPGMALSMGEGGVVVDPMAQTLAMLEKGLGDMPKLLTTPSDSLLAQPHPTDESMMLSAEEEAKVVEDYVRMMGGEPVKKAS